VATAHKRGDYTRAMIFVCHAATLFLHKTFPPVFVPDFDAKHCAAKIHPVPIGLQFFSELFCPATLRASA
jgi:hypothetical protein